MCFFEVLVNSYTDGTLYDNKFYFVGYLDEIKNERVSGKSEDHLNNCESRWSKSENESESDQLIFQPKNYDDFNEILKSTASREDVFVYFGIRKAFLFFDQGIIVNLAKVKVK